MLSKQSINHNFLLVFLEVVLNFVKPEDLPFLICPTHILILFNDTSRCCPPAYWSPPAATDFTLVDHANVLPWFYFTDPHSSPPNTLMIPWYFILDAWCLAFDAWSLMPDYSLLPVACLMVHGYQASIWQLASKTHRQQSVIVNDRKGISSLAPSDYVITGRHRYTY